MRTLIEANLCDGVIYGDGSGLTGITASSMSFANITSGNNTSASLVVDSGASLTFSGTGTIPHLLQYIIGIGVPQYLCLDMHQSLKL